MRAAWYERQGPAGEVLQVGELPDPEPGAGEVRVRVRFSGVNPGDTKKRRGWLGSSMPYPRVIPHSDAAGTVDAVGEGVAPDRTGRPVWVYGATRIGIPPQVFVFGTAIFAVGILCAIASVIIGWRKPT